MKASHRWIELVLLYVGVPLLYYVGLIPVPKLITLLIIFRVLLAVLARDKRFDGSKLHDLSAWNRFGRRILIRFALVSGALILVLAVAARDSLCILIKDRPLAWAAVVILYPLLSAYPQEVIYRAFFFHRYGTLVRNERLLVLLNAALFAFLHIVYANPVAVVFSAVGGYFFAITYMKTKSLPLAAIEHSLYGVMLFTAGLGSYFYRGS